MKKRIYWRKLDDQAKVFALASNSKYSSIFRLSVTLKDNIEQDILQKAVENALEKYNVFKVKMCMGIFWYYFEENEKKPVVSLEDDYPFKKINNKENNDYLFRVTYFNNKINIEFFHVLTDGNSGSEFFKEIIYRYLELKYPNDFSDSRYKETIALTDTENAYKKGYKKRNKKSKIAKKAYMLQGEELEKGCFAINHFNIDLKAIKHIVKEKDSSLSMYLIALIAYAIYETNYRVYRGKRPINICVPINLKKYIKTETLSNFFSYMVVNINLRKKKVYTFEEIFLKVKKEFKFKLKVEQMLDTITKDAGSTNNILVRVVPLIFKKIAVRIGSLTVKRHFTMTFSNLGAFEVEEKYKRYIDNYFVMLAPDWAERIKCGICSYEGNLVISFVTNLKDSLVERKFKELLEENNIRFSIEGNGVNDVSK